jgi:WhiB family redox-sensing transcriptional regulator
MTALAFYADLPLLPDAACRNIDDPEVFFPAKGAPAQHAKAICRPCPERTECLHIALTGGIYTSGIWGGLSEYERRRILRRRRPVEVADDDSAPEPEPAPAPAPVEPVPVPMPRAYVEPHQQRPPRNAGLDWDALTPTCRGCGGKSSTVSVRTGLCSTCATPVPVQKPKPSRRTRRGRKRATALPVPRPRRRVIGRDPDAPRRSPGTPAWAKPVNETAVIAEYQAGDSPPVIADRHGSGPKRVRDILDRHHVPRRDDRTTRSGGQPKPLDAYPRDMVDDVLSRYQAGVTAKQLAADHQVSERVVSNILAKAGVPRRLPAHVTKATVLTPDQEAELAARYAAGESSADLASRFHIRAERARQIAVAHGVTIRGRLTPAVFGIDGQEAS